jgi:hypothetical protein
VPFKTRDHWLLIVTDIIDSYEKPSNDGMCRTHLKIHERVCQLCVSSVTDLLQGENAKQQTTFDSEIMEKNCPKILKVSRKLSCYCTSSIAYINTSQLGKLNQSGWLSPCVGWPLFNPGSISSAIHSGLSLFFGSPVALVRYSVTAIFSVVRCH